jgi:hypothetical protein
MPYPTVVFDLRWKIDIVDQCRRSSEAATGEGTISAENSLE